MAGKPMTILLIEDDVMTCEKFKSYCDTLNEVKLVAVTNSSDKGIELFKLHSPEAIVLDIELHKGQGSGIEFLENIQKYFETYRPIIVVSTNASSSILYDKLHSEGVDFIFYKKQTDYSPKLIVSSLLSLRNAMFDCKVCNSATDMHIETEAEKIEKISRKINTELDLIGISSHLKGREYIHDAIMYLIQNDNTQDNESVFNYLASLHKKTASSIGRVMQTSINYAWRTSATEDLEVYYTAKVNYHTGVPTPTEFIYYYVKKIKKMF